ncbi:MAG: glycosyltransferase family 39 protein [Lachnospiraceae bacterium]|nr:glycosyltransferase family 39 protein [Lachnospiraceae bacterium]MDE6251634.1 glycosyltransferase family 39 protein [Lachnospiraceae bacterium]
MVQKSIKVKMQKILTYLKDNRIVIIFVLCLILSRIHCILFSLHGVNFDEAAIDYNIFCISHYGIDRYGNHFPVYFANAASGQSALYVYLGVILTKVIGFSVQKCRLIKLAGEVITFIYGGKVVKRFFSKRAELIFWFLYIICPYFFMMADISLDCDLIIPVFVLCIYCSEKCLESGKTRWYIGLGICIGLLGYSYIIGVLMVPLLFIYQFVADRRKINVCKAAVVSAVMYLPLGWYILTLFHIVPEIRTEYITIAGVSRYRIHDLGFSLDNLCNLKYMLITDPDYNFSGSMNFGTIYQLSFIFMVVGLAVLFMKKDKKYRFMGLLVSAFLPLLFIRDATTYNYTVLYFFILAITAAGIEFLFHDYKTLGWLTVVGYITMFVFFCREYFMSGIYIYSDDALIAAMDEVSDDEDVMLDTTGVIQPECYIGVVLKTNPKVICYDDIGNAVSFGNIVFNDSENYMEYDKALIRTEFPYLYQINSHSGLTDEQAGKISAGYLENGYIRKKIDGYYIFSRKPD